MFAKELRQAGHTKRFSISEAGNAGWEVRVEQDSEVVRRVLLHRLAPRRARRV